MAVGVEEGRRTGGQVGTHDGWMKSIRQGQGHCCIAAFASTINSSRVVGLGGTPCSAAVLIQIAVPVSCLGTWQWVGHNNDNIGRAYA